MDQAGDGTGVGWNNELLPTTQADWVGFSNPRLGPTLTASETNDPTLYKIHQRLRVEFAVQNGNVEPASVTVTGVQRAGDTHLPRFLLDVMRAYRDDYGIDLPDLSYSAMDLRAWTHSSSSVDPWTNGGVLPGRAFMDIRKANKVSDTCVRAKAVSGGLLGYRPMIAQEYVRAEVDAWRARVEAAVQGGRAPEIIQLAAREIEELFFNEFVFWDPDDGSLFYLAPPIWLQQDALVCASGSASSGSANIGDSSWMPDLYLYVDGQGVRLNAQPITCAPSSRSCAAQTGDFVRFTHLPTAADDPWDECDFQVAGRRNGNPWNLRGFETADIRPDAVKYCDEDDYERHG